MTDRPFEAELERELDRWHRRNWWMALWSALRQRAREHNNYYWVLWVGRWAISYRWIARHFYTFKAVVCLLLRRHGGPGIEVDAVDNIANWDESGPHGEYSSYDWQTLEVGHGVLRNWHCALGSDGSA